MRGAPVLALALAACGSDRAGNSSSTPSNTAAPVAQTAEPTPPAAKTAAARAPAGLCLASEQAIFECALKRGKVAVCGGESAGRRYARYRYSEGGKVELEYPGAGEAGPGTMAWASAGYSGGGETQVRFERGGYRYLVYSRVVRTGFDEEGRSAPAFEAGLALLKGDSLVADRRCVAPADAVLDQQAAARALPEGEFLYLP